MENYREASIKDIAISRKAFMLKAAREIIRESKREGSRTIELMKTMPICSFSTLEKYSRAVRDPDPVATVMTNINLKYPILCNKDWVNDNLNETERKEYVGGDDYRIGNAVSCKKELISFYIERKMAEDFTEGEISKIVYNNSREQVKSYNSINWKQSEISFNRPIFERKWVETRKVTIDIPQEIRTTLMSEMVMPGSSLYIGEIPEHYRKQFKELIRCKIADGMNIADQIRQIRISMDSRKRILPLVIDYGREMNQHLVALQSRNWVLIPNTSRVIEYQRVNRVFNQDMQLLCYLLNISKGDWAGIVNTITYEGYNLRDYLENHFHLENNQIKMIKTILNMEVSNEIVYPNITYLPISGNCEIIKRPRVNSDIWFYYRMGKETIQFRYKDTVRGHFCHNDSRLLSITCSMVSFEEFKEALSEIMVFLKDHWLNMAETNLKKLILKTKERLINDFEGIMGMNKEQENIIMMDLENMNTDPAPIEFDTKNNIRIKIEKDYVLREKESYHLRVAEEGKVLKDNKGKIIYVIERIPMPKRLTFNKEMKSNHLALIPYLHPKESIQETIKYHIHREDLVQDITRKNYTNFNRHSSMWFKEEISITLRNTATWILDRIVNGEQKPVVSKTYLAFLYTIAADAYSTYHNTILQAQLKGGIGFINLLATEGVFRYSNEIGAFLLFEQTIENRMDTHTTFLAISNWLPNYLFGPPSLLVDEYHELNTALNLLRDAPEGSKLNVLISSVKLSIIKTSNASHKREMTLVRNLSAADRKRKNVVFSAKEIPNKRKKSKDFNN